MLTNAIQRFHLDATLWLLLIRALSHRSRRTGAIHNRLRSLNMHLESGKIEGGREVAYMRSYQDPETSNFYGFLCDGHWFAESMTDDQRLEVAGWMYANKVV